MVGKVSLTLPPSPKNSTWTFVFIDLQMDITKGKQKGTDLVHEVFPEKTHVELRSNFIWSPKGSKSVFFKIGVFLLLGGCA